MSPMLGVSEELIAEIDGLPLPIPQMTTERGI